MKKLLSLMLAVTLVFSLVACGGSGETAEQATKNALDAIKSAYSEKAKEYVDYDELLDMGEDKKLDTEEQVKSDEMAKIIFEGLEYEILGSTENGESATVTANITNKDMSSVMSNLISQAFALAFSGLSGDEMDAKFEELMVELIQTEDKKVTEEINIDLVKADGKWKINMNDAFIDALSGGMMSYANGMNDAFSGGDSGEPDMAKAQKTATALKLGDTLSSERMEITVKNIEFSYDVLPKNTSGFYNHYPAESGSVYIHVEAAVKNLQKQNLDCDDVMTVWADYNGGYTYQSEPIVEDASTGFTYANITSIKPLETIGMRFLISAPQEVEETGNPLFLIFDVDDNMYKFVMR